MDKYELQYVYDVNHFTRLVVALRARGYRVETNYLPLFYLDTDAPGNVVREAAFNINVVMQVRPRASAPNKNQTRFL